MILFFFFFNDTATTEIYTLSLHDALPISQASNMLLRFAHDSRFRLSRSALGKEIIDFDFERTARSEEHTSELQSQSNLVCRLLLEKKKNIKGSRNMILGYIVVLRPDSERL